MSAQKSQIVNRSVSAELPRWPGGKVSTLWAAGIETRLSRKMECDYLYG